MRKSFLALVLMAHAVSAAAQIAAPGPKAINTGGAAGAYHTTFCPPLPTVLATAFFQGYSCTPSAGTLQNIDRVLAQPSNIGFAQFDVFAREAARRPQEFSRLAVIRADIACEGLWLVTRNPDLSFGRMLGLSRRIRFVLPAAQSGSAASFDYLRSIDPDGLGRVPDSNITHLADATAVINHIANSNEGEVGFFVQFADPRNANIRLMVERRLNIVPVISREILRARVGDTSVYEPREFVLTEGGLFGVGGRDQRATTACTQVAIFTGTPDSFADRNGREDARDLIERVRQVPRESLLPRDDVVSRMLRGATRLSQTAVDQMSNGVETARRAATGQ